MGTPDARPSLAVGALAHWLDAHGHTQMWLAKRLEISVASASRICRGTSMPRPRLAQKIETLTDGEVTVADLARAKISMSPYNRAARIRHAEDLIDRGRAILVAVSKEEPS